MARSECEDPSAIDLSDEALTTEGLGPRGNGSVLVIACGALAHEIVALKRQNGWTHIDLVCLPAILHNHPERITPEVEKAVAKHCSRYDKLFIAYADCGTGGQLQAAAERLGIEMIAGPHCYAFFDGTDAFLARGDDEFRCFYLTDFLVRQFDAFVWKPLGLDRHAELLPMYFGHYEKLVYQAQTDDPDLDALARGHAKRLGLSYVRRFTGYGDLGTSLARL